MLGLLRLWVCRIVGGWNVAVLGKRVLLRRGGMGGGGDMFFCVDVEDSRKDLGFRA